MKTGIYDFEVLKRVVFRLLENEGRTRYKIKQLEFEWYLCEFSWDSELITIAQGVSVDNISFTFCFKYHGILIEKTLLFNACYYIEETENL